MKKINMGFISFLMLISLVCIGFSSWNITYESSDSVNGSIDVDELIDGSKYISCTDFTLFKFFKTGFVDNNGLISYSSTINTSFNINMTECINRFKDSTYLEVIIDLSRNNFGKFNRTDYITLTHEIKYNDTIISGNLTSTNTDYILTFEIPLSNELTNSTIDILYSFSIAKNDNALEYFEQTIYPELMSTNKFGINAKVTGN